MNYNYRDWIAIKKVDKPMSELRTINYLIKCYNIKKISNINHGRFDRADKCDLLIQSLQNVKKNLQVLEALKRNAYVYNDEINIILNNDDEDFNSVKEWLNEK